MCCRRGHVHWRAHIATYACTHIATYHATNDHTATHHHHTYTANTCTNADTCTHTGADHDANAYANSALRGIMVCLQPCDVSQDVYHHHSEARRWR